MLVEETDERELSQLEVIEGRGACDGERGECEEEEEESDQTTQRILSIMVDFIDGEVRR